MSPVFVLVLSIAAAIVSVTAMIVNAAFTRRAEHAAQQGKVAAQVTARHAESGRRALQRVQGLTEAYADEPAPVVPQRLCPIDGAPLAGYEATLGKPAVFTHQDGTMHPDLTAQMTSQTLPDPAVLPDSRPDAQPLPHGTPGQVPTPSNSSATVNAYMQRAQTAADAGLFDPDSLRTGLADITRGNWLPEAPPPDAPIDPPSTPQHAARRMPDPTRATRVRGARLAPPRPGPLPRNGDGS